MSAPTLCLLTVRLVFYWWQLPSTQQTLMHHLCGVLENLENKSSTCNVTNNMLLYYYNILTKIETN